MVFVVYFGIYAFNNPDITMIEKDGKMYPSACYVVDNDYYLRAQIAPNDPAYAPEDSTNVTSKFEMFFIFGFAIYLITALNGCIGHLGACTESETIKDIFKSTSGFMCCCG
jgi:hypothetical protein